MKEFTFEDFKRAATGHLTPFTDAEVAELKATKNEDEFWTLYKQLRKKYGFEKVDSADPDSLR